MKELRGVNPFRSRAGPHLDGITRRCTDWWQKPSKAESSARLYHTKPNLDTDSGLSVALTVGTDTDIRRLF